MSKAKNQKTKMLNSLAATFLKEIMKDFENESNQTVSKSIPSSKHTNGSI
jgi:hypothetical protein